MSPNALATSSSRHTLVVVATVGAGRVLSTMSADPGTSTVLNAAPTAMRILRRGAGASAIAPVSFGVGGGLGRCRLPEMGASSPPAFEPLSLGTSGLDCCWFRLSFPTTAGLSFAIVTCTNRAKQTVSFGWSVRGNHVSLFETKESLASDGYLEHMAVVERVMVKACDRLLCARWLLVLQKGKALRTPTRSEVSQSTTAIQQFNLHTGLSSLLVATDHTTHAPASGRCGRVPSAGSAARHTRRRAGAAPLAAARGRRLRKAAHAPARAAASRPACQQGDQSKVTIVFSLALCTLAIWSRVRGLIV